MKKYFSLILALNLLMSCSSHLPPKERVASWDEWEIFHRLADYTFKGSSKWLWYTTAEITKRNLQNNPRCKSVYESRIGALVRKYEKSNISISFDEAINGKLSLE